jgi:hypothetical protein
MAALRWRISRSASNSPFTDGNPSRRVWSVVTAGSGSPYRWCGKTGGEPWSWSTPIRWCVGNVSGSVEQLSTVAGQVFTPNRDIRAAGNHGTPR